MKIKCVLRNEQIDNLATNHSPTLLPKQERMWTLNAKEMEPSSKIDLKDVLWWMSIKNTYRPKALVIFPNSQKKKGASP
jgi:hypothetical protein